MAAKPKNTPTIKINTRIEDKAKVAKSIGAHLKSLADAQEEKAKKANPLTRQIKGLKQQVMREQRLAMDLEKQLEAALAEAEKFKAGWTDAANRFGAYVREAQRTISSNGFVIETLRRERDEAQQAHASIAAEIKALKEENARLRDKAVDADMLKGAVNALRRVIVEALQG